MKLFKVSQPYIQYSKKIPHLTDSFYEVCKMDKLVSFRLSKTELDKIRVLGNGNVSEGLRRAVIYYMGEANDNI